MVKKGLLVAGFLCLVIFVALNLFSPSVTIKNESGEYVYIRASEGIHNSEPSPEKMKKVTRKKPDVVARGETIKITLSPLATMARAVELHNGWLIGGRFSYNATGAGWQSFRLLTNKGMCSMTLKVYKGQNNFFLETNEGHFCLKKITPFTVTY